MRLHSMQTFPDSHRSLANIGRAIDDLDADSPEQLQQLAARLRGGEAMTSFELGRLVNRLDEFDIEPTSFLTAAVRALRDTARQHARSPFHEFKLVHTALAAVPITDARGLALREQTYDLINNNVAVMNSSYWFPDFAELGRIATNVELLDAMTRRTRAAAGAAASSAMEVGAARTAERLTW